MQSWGSALLQLGGILEGVAQKPRSVKLPTRDSRQCGLGELPVRLATSTAEQGAGEWVCRRLLGEACWDQEEKPVPPSVLLQRPKPTEKKQRKAQLRDCKADGEGAFGAEGPSDGG